MEKSPKPASTAEMQAVREGIKRRYVHYHTLDSDTYPAFEFNSNRANYQPLKDSFEEEFFVSRKLDRVENHLHIPSLNTLALIFSDDTYVPSRKILNTCRSYAQGSAQPVATPRVIAPVNTPTNHRQTKLFLISTVTLLFALLTGLALYWFVGRPTEKPKASGLVIQRPSARQVVSQITYVEGRVTNADFVWVVVHPASRDTTYYVQDLAKVNKDGSWKCRIYVGRPDSLSNGYSFEIRAYVKPGGSYQAITEKGQYEYDTWPETAELATESIVVVRGAPRQK